MANMKLRLLIVLGFILVGLFGTALCEILNDNNDDTSTIMFFHNDSFSGIMPINPGNDIVINIENDATIDIVTNNCSVLYTITEDGFIYRSI